MPQRETNQQIRLFPCGFREEDLIASALGEADDALQQAVRSHIRHCAECHSLFQSYSTINQLCSRLQEAESYEEHIRKARMKLDRFLVSKPVVHLYYGLFSSPVGKLCIAKSERGVSFISWQNKMDRLLSQCKGSPHIVAEEDGEDLQRLFKELEAYLAGQCHHLDWPIDDQMLKSDFQREVFKVLSEVPYGAVISYQGLAEAMGRPKAVRAVAQALRFNPLPIVIPCHRVIGSDGHLTGYAGGLEIKRRLLALEGIPLQIKRSGPFINREQMYVGWRSSHEYCLPTCPSLKKISPGEMLLLSGKTAPRQLGFTPCDACHPELAPLAPE